jgi:hypothetical protein
VCEFESPYKEDNHVNVQCISQDDSSSSSEDIVEDEDGYVALFSLLLLFNSYVLDFVCVCVYIRIGCGEGGPRFREDE